MQQHSDWRGDEQGRTEFVKAREKKAVVIKTQVGKSLMDCVDGSERLHWGDVLQKALASFRCRLDGGRSED